MSYSSYPGLDPVVACFRVSEGGFLTGLSEHLTGLKPPPFQGAVEIEDGVLALLSFPGTLP